LPTRTPPTFAIEIRPDRSRVVVELSGELDCATVPGVATELDSLRAAGWEAIALDVRRVSFVESSGLRLFLEADARARAEGWRFELDGTAPAVERLLAITGLTGWFPRA